MKVKCDDHMWTTGWQLHYDKCSLRVRTWTRFIRSLTYFLQALFMKPFKIGLRSNTVTLSKCLLLYGLSHNITVETMYYVISLL